MRGLVSHGHDVVREADATSQRLHRLRVEAVLRLVDDAVHEATDRHGPHEALSVLADALELHRHDGRGGGRVERARSGSIVHVAVVEEQLDERGRGLDGDRHLLPTTLPGLDELEAQDTFAGIRREQQRVHELPFGPVGPRNALAHACAVCAWVRRGGSITANSSTNRKSISISISFTRSHCACSSCCSLRVTHHTTCCSIHKMVPCLFCSPLSRSRAIHSRITRRSCVVSQEGPLDRGKVHQGTRVLSRAGRSPAVRVRVNVLAHWLTHTHSLADL